MLRLFLSLLLLSLAACQSDAPASEKPLRPVQRPSDEACAYVSIAGDTIIPFGRYDKSVTERFAAVAIVRRVGRASTGTSGYYSSPTYSTRAPIIQPKDYCAS